MADVSLQIEQAKNGDEVALAGVIACQMPIIYYYAKKVVANGFEFDDAVQEGIIGVFDAIETFNNNKNTSFKTYSSVCIRNAIYAAARLANRKKYQPLNNSVPLDETQSVVGPEQIAIENESFRITVRKINQELSKFEKKVLKLFLHNYSYYEISQKLLCTPKSVDNALNRVRQKLKK